METPIKTLHVQWTPPVTFKSCAFRLLVTMMIARVGGVLDVSTAYPPRGFNSFDSYPGLNHSTVIMLATAIKDQLLSSGYDTVVLDGGWSADKNGEVLDEYGRPMPDPERFPQGMKALADEVHSMGLKIGLWNMRGVQIAAVSNKLQIKGTNYTFDSPGFIDEQPVGGGPNGSCLWNKGWLGVNRSHPAAQTYYNSRIEPFAEWGIDFLKTDCMMCGPCYTDEMIMYTQAVKDSPATFVLSYSPGGGNEPKDGKWVAQNQIGTMYRIVTDFHGGWYGWGGLQQAIFIAGNFTTAKLNGANGTYPDLDMLPLGANFWGPTEKNQKWTPEMADRGQTIITLDMISRSPLMHAGKLPADPKTLEYETNPTALEIHAHGNPTVMEYQGNCTCSGGPGGSCTIPHDDDRFSNTLTSSADDPPCMAIWSSWVDQKYTAIAVFNMGEANGTATIRLDQVPSWESRGKDSISTYDESAVYEITDVWTGESKTAEWPLTVNVNLHGAAFFKVQKHDSA